MIDPTELKHIADRCHHLATLLWNEKQGLITWDWITSSAAIEVIQLLETSGITKLSDDKIPPATD